MLCFNNQQNHQRSVHCGDVIVYSSMLVVSSILFVFFSTSDDNDRYSTPSKIAVGTMGLFSLGLLTKSGYQLYKTFAPARILPEAINNNNEHQSLWTNLFKSLATSSFSIYQRMFNSPPELTDDNLNSYFSQQTNEQVYSQEYVEEFSTVRAFFGSHSGEGGVPGEP